MPAPEIDFVLPWVDGLDPAWKQSYDSYSVLEDHQFNQNNERFRDWGLLPFWFRGVERFAPWVRKIHFITCGHYPSWLNLSHPKLHFVTHEEFIPANYLPTFNSRVIELFFHRIEGLSEQFVYFNDDMFLSAPVSPSDFFKKGLPREIALRNYIGHYEEGYTELNIVRQINQHLDFYASYKSNLWKWYNFRYGWNSLRNLQFVPYKDFTGIKNMHLPSPFLKKTFLTVWESCENALKITASHKFREISDVNQWLFEWWSIATGQFYPQDYSFGRLLTVSDVDAVQNALLRQSLKTICINDFPGADYERLMPKLQSVFLKAFPDKSSFELVF